MKAGIADKLANLERYIRLLKGYSSKEKEDIIGDPTLRGAVERYMQLAIEVVIEIGEMIIASDGLDKPESYKEVIEALGKAGILEKKFTARFAPIAGLRNILVHRYAEVDTDELYYHLTHDLGDFDSFAKQVASYTKSRRL